MNPLQAALRDADTLLVTHWVRIVCTDTKVELDYGVLHTNGFREVTIATRIYNAYGSYRTLVHR